VNGEQESGDQLEENQRSQDQQRVNSARLEHVFPTRRPITLSLWETKESKGSEKWIVEINKK
jgi:hypothetical protein